MSTYRYFARHEMECRCGCGRADMRPEFMAKLERMRADAGFPFPVSSAFRCPEWNARVSGTGKSGPHTTGRAIDIVARGERALWIVSNAQKYGFSGVGVSQKGDARFIHLDDLSSPDYPRPNIWSY